MDKRGTQINRPEDKKVGDYASKRWNRLCVSRKEEQCDSPVLRIAQDSPLQGFESNLITEVQIEQQQKLGNRNGKKHNRMDISNFQKKNSNFIIFYFLRVFHISFSWWFFTGVWVKSSFLKSPGLFSVFWPFSHSSSDFQIIIIIIIIIVILLIWEFSH